MKIPAKNKVNILLGLSLLLFVFVCIFHVNQEKKLNAFGLSLGGRFTVITLSAPPAFCTTANPSPLPPCGCGTLHSTFMPAGNISGVVLCFPLTNKPNSGSPVTIESAGHQFLGSFTTTAPVAVSPNWGTSLMAY